MKKSYRYGKKWTKEEDEFLLKNLGNFNLVKQITGRSIQAIEQRYNKLKKEHHEQ